MTKTLLGAASAIALALPAFAADPDLIVLDWAGFDVPGLVQGYADKNGDAPTYSLFGDDDEAFQKVASGFRADVGHPCSQMVSKYRDAGLIEPWDVSRIPAYDKIDARFTDSPIFKDDTGVWFIPTDYAYTAVAYNPDTVPEEDVQSLEVFKDPKYAGRISLPDNTDDIWALAYLATGVTDWTNATDEQFEAAAQWLRDVHPNVVAYWADPAELTQLMAGGQVQVAWSWNDGVALMQEDNFPIAFNRQAKEGASSFFCGYVNFKGAPGNEDKAYDFINSWLAPESAQVLVDNIGYAHTNPDGMAMVSEEDLKTAYLDPVEGTLLSQTPIDNQMRDRMVQTFEEIKAGF
ncbi:ABC transporter substrate-binding protein [Falsirhodobacter sp. 20TX0035]|uniref:ABC transporter substrate-binding protein n=1 Tax=Falsirhodobacter sp. 20TX0035 TaxID=3022019 RepID=UPI00233053A6|nr:extracellular solute-binding protein [Falsirhodobacter sp. 20TX0035]MDB6452119.1 extracellular solute-binding protein [Falsirhodobacter sp. 20TX0035]